MLFSIELNMGHSIELDGTPLHFLFEFFYDWTRANFGLQSRNTLLFLLLRCLLGKFKLILLLRGLLGKFKLIWVYNQRILYPLVLKHFGKPKAKPRGVWDLLRSPKQSHGKFIINEYSLGIRHFGETQNKAMRSILCKAMRSLKYSLYQYEV